MTSIQLTKTDIFCHLQLLKTKKTEKCFGRNSRDVVILQESKTDEEKLLGQYVYGKFRIFVNALKRTQLSINSSVGQSVYPLSKSLSLRLVTVRWPVSQSVS